MENNLSSQNLLAKNRELYDNLWGGAWLLEADNFNTWPLVKKLSKNAQTRLEVAPGLRPRLPIEGTTFVDISQSALSVLSKSGGTTFNASICELPFGDNQFDLVCALDIVEHVEDDVSAFAELSRVARDGATLLLSTPLHQEWWTPFDEFVGHYRRYAPDRLLEILDEHDFEIKQSAVFGMKPKSSLLVDVGMWFLQNTPNRAMWWYNRILPYVAKRQKPLALVDGINNLDEIGEVFLVCERRGRT